MANNLITAVVITCGRLSCQEIWQYPLRGEINECPKCGWNSDDDKVLIARDLRKKGLRIDASSNT